MALSQLEPSLWSFVVTVVVISVGSLGDFGFALGAIEMGKTGEKVIAQSQGHLGP